MSVLELTPFGANFGTLEIAAIIIGPTLIICAIGVMFYLWYYKSKRGLHHQLGRGEDSIEAPDHPILNGGVSLRHMIEMTTSGSGSGKFVIVKTESNRLIYIIS